MLITIYGRKTCAPCRTIKQWLTHKGHVFNEVDLDEFPERSQEVLNLGGRLIVPTTVIGAGKNLKVVQGLNLSRISSLL